MSKLGWVIFGYALAFVFSGVAWYTLFLLMGFGKHL